jgi:hypothetical protein
MYINMAFCCGALSCFKLLHSSVASLLTDAIGLGGVIRIKSAGQNSSNTAQAREVLQKQIFQNHLFSI